MILYQLRVGISAIKLLYLYDAQPTYFGTIIAHYPYIYKKIS